MACVYLLSPPNLLDLAFKMKKIKTKNKMTEEPQYAKFWDRFGAYILDAIIVGLISYGINYLNFTTVKSFYVYLPIAIIGIWKVIIKQH